MGRGFFAGGATVCAALLAVLAGAAPARAAVVCDTPPAAPVARSTPHEQQVYAGQRLAPLATGAGVRVAVVDSGVDARHPQLSGRVAVGADFLRGEPDGRQDCVGHGTAVAGIIAAAAAPGTGFRGLAPGATIVPVRISEQEEIDGAAAGERGTPAQFARAIDWAAGPGRAQVINLSLVMTADSPPVRRAVARALAAGVVVVAAVGNRGGEQDANPTPYPAAYDGVIGVGAVTAAGVLAPYSQRGPYVDLVAAGDGVTAAARGGGHQVVRGTSFAAPFVAATAALIRQRFPALTPAQVERRLVATADPAPGGGRSPGYGYGLLNPYRALTATLGTAGRPPPVPALLRGDDPAVAALAARRERSRDRAVLFSGVAAGAVLLISAAAVVAGRGRRRGWRPAGPEIR